MKAINLSDLQEMAEEAVAGMGDIFYDPSPAHGEYIDCHNVAVNRTAEALVSLAGSLGAQVVVDAEPLTETIGGAAE